MDVIKFPGADVDADRLGSMDVDKFQRCVGILNALCGKIAVVREVCRYTHLTHLEYRARGIAEVYPTGGHVVVIGLPLTGKAMPSRMYEIEDVIKGFRKLTGRKWEQVSEYDGQLTLQSPACKAVLTIQPYDLDGELCLGITSISH